MKPRVKQFASQFPNKLAGLCSALFVLGALCAGQVGHAQQSTSVMPSAVVPTKAQPATAANALAAIPQAAPASAATPLSALSNLGLRKSLASPAFKEVSEAEDSSLPNGATQGIKVHGHWVIDVKNPDGSLAAHREFENSLTGANQGQLLLGGLLSGYYVAGDYAIQLGTSICAGTGKCSIIASQSGEPGSYLCTQGECFATLKYTYNLAPTTGNQIDAYMVMTGSAVPDETGTLDTVSTVYNVCDFTNGYTGSGAPVLPTGVTSVAPASCIGTNNSAFISTFTSTTVTPTISITSGQVISVTVTISFS
jgi:hypothetical protein